MSPGRAGDPERHGVLLGRRQRTRMTPGDLLQRKPERFSVGELAVEQLQRHTQGGELLVRECDRR